MGFLARAIRKQFEDKKPPELTVKADIRMISGCEDRQTSADGAFRASVLMSCLCSHVVPVFVEGFLFLS
jgi:hypothetical protein